MNVVARNIFNEIATCNKFCTLSPIKRYEWEDAFEYMVKDIKAGSKVHPAKLFHKWWNPHRDWHNKSFERRMIWEQAFNSQFDPAKYL